MRGDERGWLRTIILWVDEQKGNTLRSEWWDREDENYAVQNDTNIKLPVLVVV
jgi:hypothetical protein